MAHNPNLENDVNKLHPLLERKSLTYCQSMPLRLFYSLGFDLVAVLHATTFLATVSQELRLISLHLIFLLATSSDLIPGL